MNYLTPLYCYSPLVCPERGPAPGTPRRDPTFQGSGQVRVDSIHLGVPWGRAPKVLRRTGRGGLGCDQAYWIPYSPCISPGGSLWLGLSYYA